MDALAVKNLLSGIAANVFERCQVRGCEAHSLGMTCSDCSRRVCQGHYYLTASLPPQLVCVRCILAEFTEGGEMPEPADL